MKKRKIYFLIIILILIFIILNIYKSKNNILNDIIIFSLWNDISGENTFNINPQEQEGVKIDIFQTVNKGIYKKIKPGSYGTFTIKLKRPKESNCEIKLKDITTKPQNLIFILDGKKYYTIEQMQEKLNQYFQVQDNVTINWEWKYEQSEEKDIEDTKDGENLQKYIFEIRALIDD